MTVRSISADLPVRLVGTVFALVAIAGGIAVAAISDMLPLALAGSALAILLLVGWRSPVLILVLFAVLVPLEDTLSFGEAGTASRFVGVIFAVAYVVKRGKLPRLSTMPVAGWAFVLWAVASGLWTVDLVPWADGIGTLLQMFVLALLVGDLVSRNPGAVGQVMWAYSASAVATVLVLVAAPTEVVGTSRLTAFSGQDPAQFSAVLVPAFLFLVHEAARTASRPAPGRLAAMVILACAGLVAWGALATGTGSAIVGLGVGLAAMAVAGTGRRGSRISVAAVGLVGAGAALLAPGVVDSVAMRLSGAVTTGGAGRADVWAVGATIFAQHPFNGVGYAAFSSAFTSDVIQISAVPGLDLESLFAGRAPHSILVGTAAELGVIGIGLLGLFVWRVLRARSGPSLANFVRVAIIGMLAQATLLDVLERKQLWLVLGMAVGLAATSRVQEAGVTAHRWPLGVNQAPARLLVASSKNLKARVD